MLVLSVGVSADGLSVVLDTGAQIIDTETLQPISEQRDTARSATTGIVSGAVYRIKNVGSGKYMNVHYGNDVNGTNIYQWTADGSTEQKFRVVYFANSDSYLIYAMCSSKRIVSVAHNNSNLANGQNIHLYSTGDDTAQRVHIVSLGQNQYRISMKANTNLHFAAYGDTNGTAGGTNATSAGNIYLSSYVGEMYQHWIFELVENPPNPVGYLDEVSSSKIGGWAYQTGLPDTPIDVHIYVKNNSTNKQKLFAVTANGYRSDLKNAGYGDGCHAFSYSMSWGNYPSGTYTVSAYGINVNGGTNSQLTNSPRNFTVRKATGTMDEMTSTFIRGWAWKPDAPNNSVEVHLYIRTSDGKTVFANVAVADIYRPDVAAAGYGTGYYGYSIPIDWSTLPKEELQVTLYAVDGSGENPTFYNGYYNNAPPHGAITLYGIKHSDTNDRKLYYTDAVKTGISNIGVTETRGLYVGTTATQALNNMKSSMIWVVHTHGWKQGVLFNHSTSGETSLLYENISSLAVNALAGERCVIFGTCSAGEGGEGAENMVNITHAKGAMTVIGWTTTTYVSQMNTWLEAFFVSSGGGNNIVTAVGEALEEVYDNYDDLGGLDAIYSAGSITQKLVS